MSNPVFPEIVPRQIKPPWFQPDQPVDEDRELTLLEQQYQAKLERATSWLNDKLPIGRNLLEILKVNEEDEEEEEEDHEDEDSESREEGEDTDMEAEIPFNRDQMNEIPEGINLSMDFSD